MDIKNRTLFFGDNLNVLEKLPDESFDLIYLDPPFNSNRNYNVLFKEGKVDSSAQIHAFEDTWEWTPETNRLFVDLKLRSDNPKISMLINSMAEIIGIETPMMAYIINMTARLVPLKKVLKSTGSFYLHCDPTASHYLKVILDVIFGKENFRNELIWLYSGRELNAKQWNSKHDDILFYTKTDKWYFDWESVAEEPSPEVQAQYKFIDEAGKKYVIRNKSGSKGLSKEGMDTYRQYEKKVPPRTWKYFSIVSSSSERLGYPTQKPEALLERIIKASSKEGDWILDPFCGCGTTVAVAEKLHRNWVGIDISMQAINVIAQRMKAHYPNIKINIDGIPADFGGAKKLAENDKYSFQDWAITLVDANPPSGESKKGADRGIDGLILFYEKSDFNNPSPKFKKIIVQVKGGGTGRGDVAKLKGDMEREEAPMGILITLNDPTSEMKREASSAGEYKYSGNVSFPRVQLLSIREYFEGRFVELPSDRINPFKKAQAKEGADQEVLF